MEYKTKYMYKVKLFIQDYDTSRTVYFESYFETKEHAQIFCEAMQKKGYGTDLNINTWEVKIEKAIKYWDYQVESWDD